MQQEVIEVPQDKSVLTVLKKLGEQTKNSRIFFHLNLYRKISRRKAEFNLTILISADDIRFTWWERNGNTPNTHIYLENFSGSSDVWIEVLRIESTDIAFNTPSKNPENIYFLQMEENL